MIKALLYIVILPFTIWMMEALDINKLFKKNRVIQARFIYLMLAISATYLVTNFFYDFFLSTKIL